MECSLACAAECSEDCSEDCSCSVVYWSVMWCSGGCKLKMLQNLHILLTFDKVHNPLRLSRETTPEPPKVVRH